MIEIDSVGTFIMCHEALKYLKKGGPGKDSSSGGIIINISATLHYTATWYQIHVSAAKVGAFGFKDCSHYVGSGLCLIVTKLLRFFIRQLLTA